MTPDQYRNSLDTGQTILALKADNKELRSKNLSLLTQLALTEKRIRELEESLANYTG